MAFAHVLLLPWEHPMHVNVYFLRNFHTSDSISFRFVPFRSVPFHSATEYLCVFLFNMKWNSINKSLIKFSKIPPNLSDCIENLILKCCILYCFGMIFSLFDFILFFKEIQIIDVVLFFRCLFVNVVQFCRTNSRPKRHDS